MVPLPSASGVEVPHGRHSFAAQGGDALSYSYRMVLSCSACLQVNGRNMLVFPLMAPAYEMHASFCDYGHLFSFVPGDPGNPFVALWQADLAQAVALLAGGLVLVGMGRARGHRGGARYLGYALLVGAAASAVLTVVTLISSTPLACGGAPGVAAGSSADQRAYQTFQTLSALSTLMLYLTLLLVAAAIIASMILVVRRAWGASGRERHAEG